MILVFDLDDTLYPEISYVKSGFRNVSQFISERYAVDQEMLFDSMWTELGKNGRGKVFDATLMNFQLYSQSLVKKCLGIYRTHVPNIKLYDSTLPCLDRFKGLPLYLVTDGNKVVQDIKVQSLNLNPIFRKVYITHRFGLDKAKPSTYCFNLILERENASAKDLVYIADNPHKDFVNLNKEGFNTVRVLTGHYKNQFLTANYEAMETISNLNDLTFDLLKKIQNT